MKKLIPIGLILAFVSSLALSSSSSWPTTTFGGILPVSNGGTNSSTALSNNRVMKSSAGAIVEAAAITASRALASDANGIPVAATTTTTELNYVSGVTSALQTQLNAKQATGNYVTALTGDVTASGPGSVAATVAAVGGKTAAAVATSVTDTVAATASASGATIVKRDGAGNFAAGTITANLTGNASGTALSITGVNAVANGGTASSASLNNNRVMKSAGSAIVEAAAITASRALASDSNGIPVAATTTTTELNFVNGVTSALQTQIDGKQATITGGATTIASSNLTVSRALVSDGSGKVAIATTTATEIGYVNGVTSAIQTQLNGINAGKGVVSVAGNVTLTDQRIHFVSTAAARTLTLPAPATTSWIEIKDSTGSCSTNNITVVRFGSEKIETVAASYTLNNDNGAWTFVSDGTDWFVL